MRFASTRVALTALLSVCLVACTHSDPKSVKAWVAKVKSERGTREKKADMAHLRQIAAACAEPDKVAQVASLLKDQPGDVKQVAAEVLGKLGDKSAVPALVDAIDMSRGAGTDRLTEQANHANRAIAEALGQLGDPAATSGLLKLLRSKDNYTVIGAINALGKLRDAAAVKPLSSIATDTSIETFINKKAIMALGDIGSADAIPAIHEMLYAERKGISFYAESSFALFEIGKPAIPVIQSDLSGKDPTFASWAKDHGVLRGAILAKSAQLLGDLNDTSAEGELLKLLSYKDDQAALQLATRMQAADALGRMRAHAAVKPLTAMLGEEEVAARNTYYRALRFIGDPSVAAVALKKATSKESIGYREDAYRTAAMLGGPGELKAYDAALEAEPTRLHGECKDNEIADADCKAQIDQVTARLKAYRGALATGCAAGQSACWQGKLKDADPYVRGRAALELGRANAASAFPALIAVIQKPIDAKTNDEVAVQDEARFAAILAVHWLLDGGAKPAGAAEVAKALEAQVAKEKSQTATMRSAEDVKRLAVRLGRA